MSLTRAPLEQAPNATNASWYAPIAMLVAWLAQLFEQITKLKRIRRTTKFKPNWADHWDGLRRNEWRRDQLITQCTAHVLAGGSLDDDKPVDILPDPPAGYGACPRTPFEMNRRFIYLARFLADPTFFIQRRIARIAKRERPDLSAFLAALSHFAIGNANAQCWRMCALRAHDGGGLPSCARGPPSHGILQLT